MTPRKLLLVFSIILFICFIFFSYLVAKETFVNFDFDTTVRLQDHISHRFDLPFSLFSILGSAEITGLIWIFLAVYLLVRKFYKAFLAMALLPLALLMEFFGKTFVYHPSPPHLFYRGVLKVDFPSSYVHAEYSYPSGHLTRTAFLLSFCSAYFYLRMSKKYQIIIQPILLLFFIGMVISRIYLGEHWTSDVIGGSLIGISFGIFSAILIPRKKLI